MIPSLFTDEIGLLTLAVAGRLGTSLVYLVYPMSAAANDRQRELSV